MASEEMECADRLALLRWGEHPSCGHCLGTHWCHLSSRPRVYQCRACGKQRSVTAGTILHGMKVPLATWFRAVELYCSADGISTRGLARALEIPVKTAFTMLHRIRKAVAVEGEPLKGEVGTWRGWIKCSRRPRVQWRTIALVATDLRQIYVDVTHRHTLQERFPEADTESEGSKKLFKRAVGSAMYVLSTLRYTHRQVSQRYLERYTTSIAFCWLAELSADPVGMVARLCMEAPRLTFAELQPAWDPG